MNVLTEATIAITMLHARIMSVHLIALVIPATLEMALIAKVSSAYEKYSGVERNISLEFN